MGCSSVPDEPINQYALVTYLPEELGAYLDKVRKDLVPDCQARSHLSILPPRPLSVSQQAAESQLDSFSRQSQPVVIRVGGVAVFPRTGVIYLEIESGHLEVEKFHASLNREAFAFQEPYPFHPHITLAQNFASETGEMCLEKARLWWAQYPGRREFLIDRFVFVQNSCTNCWRDLRSFSLQGMPNLTPSAPNEATIRTF